MTTEIITKEIIKNKGQETISLEPIKKIISNESLTLPNSIEVTDDTESTYVTGELPIKKRKTAFGTIGFKLDKPKSKKVLFQTFSDEQGKHTLRHIIIRRKSRGSL